MSRSLSDDELTEMLEQASILPDGSISTRLELRQFAAVVARKCIEIGVVRDIVAFFSPPMHRPV